MDHKERVLQKQKIYADNGYSVTPVTSTEDQSVFYSAKDDVFRKHIYMHNDALVQLASKTEYQTAGGVTGIVVPAVEVFPELAPIVVPQPNPVVEKPAAKKTSKKKGA